MSLRIMICIGCVVVLGLAVWAQGPVSDQQEAACTFEDGGQISVRYAPAAAHGEHPPAGKAWSPGEGPVLLFTSTPLSAGGARIPTGAYSLYVIANKNEWTLLVNKDVSDTRYDEQQNLARLTMDLGMVEQPGKNVTLALGHVGPKQCNLRLYYGKTGAWASFREP
jgi:hypothetical protein